MLVFWIASGVSALWFGVHLVLGGREVAQPLLVSTLDPLPRDVLYMCWHFVSAGIGAMALFFGLAAWLGDTPYAVAGTVLAAAFTIIGVLIATTQGQSHAKMPQGWLFLPIAALGLWGLLA